MRPIPHRRPFNTCYDCPILSRRAVNSIGSGASYRPKTADGLLRRHKRVRELGHGPRPGLDPGEFLAERGFRHFGVVGHLRPQPVAAR